jgi:hypothetical protein
MAKHSLGFAIVRAMIGKQHPSARTTPQLRLELQARKAESSRALALRFGLNPKTVDKWKRRPTTADAPMGPKPPVSTALSAAGEAVIVIFRKHTRLRLDDCLARLKPLIPHLSRSALHRCLKRYGVNRIPLGRAEKLRRIPHSREPGRVTIAVHAVSSEAGEFFVLTAISELTRFVFARWTSLASAYSARNFLSDLVNQAPIIIRTVQTDDFEAFADPTEHPWDPRFPGKEHPFEQFCRENGIRHVIGQEGILAPKPITKGWTTVAEVKAYFDRPRSDAERTS